MRNYLSVFTIVLIVSVLFVVAAFYLWKREYIRYNLLRLNPLEESAQKLSELRNNKIKANVIWLLGDSRMAQWDTNYLEPLNCTIINLGIEGQTSKQVLENFKNYLEISRPKSVVLQVGINDFKVIGLISHKSNEIEYTCYSNTIEILNECRKNNILVIYTPIILTGKIELFRRLIWNPGIDIKIRDFNGQMKEYCQQNGIMYFDTQKLFEDIPAEMKKEYSKGFLHLSKKGYEFLSVEFIRFYNKQKIDNMPIN